MGFRNFILHYHLPELEIRIRHSEERSVDLLLNSSSLLYSGFKWKAGARNFVQRDANVDVTKTLGLVSRDVNRLIKFHQKMVDVRLRDEKLAFDTYQYERRRFKHLQNSAVDVRAAFFKRSTPMIRRLLDKNLVDQVLSSLMSDDDVQAILTIYAGRHGNLTRSAKNSLEREVKDLIRKRTQFNNCGTFLQGRAFE